jgi:hypothetical protein
MSSAATKEKRSARQRIEGKPKVWVFIYLERWIAVGRRICIVADCDEKARGGSGVGGLVGWGGDLGQLVEAVAGPKWSQSHAGCLEEARQTDRRAGANLTMDDVMCDARKRSKNLRQILRLKSRSKK